MDDTDRYFKEHKNKANWVDEEIESEPDPSREEIIRKTLEVFGVDISSVYDDYIVDILLHIAENYKRSSNKD